VEQAGGGVEPGPAAVSGPSRGRGGRGRGRGPSSRRSRSPGPRGPPGEESLSLDEKGKWPKVLCVLRSVTLAVVQTNPEFVNQELILAWRVGTTTLFDVPARKAT
jgi:hypothetical protein